jgi:hypothetical protein
MVERHPGSRAIHALNTPQRERGRLARLPVQMRVALLAALVSLALGTWLAAPLSRPAQAAPARANIPSCNGPCVGITNPLYTAQGQLVAEGPVGAHLTVEGANWPASTILTIWPAPDANTCAQQQQQPPGYAGQITVNGAGNAQGSYDWPSAAHEVNRTYILCAVDGAASNITTTQSNGIDTYTVLAANPPSLAISPSTLTQGQPNNALTVRGKNWLPQQALTVTICSDASNCATSQVANQTTASAQDGTFEITIPVPSTTAAGSYFVQAVSANNALTAPPANTPAQLTISTPTPTPTPTPSPTPTPTPTPPSTSSSDGKGGTILLIVLLGTLSVLFLVGGIISLSVYTRSNA